MRISWMLAGAGLFLSAAPAMAQIPEPGGVRVGGEALLLSDYRFRGISRSDRDPALQGSVTVSGYEGWYLGGRAMTLKDAGSLGGAELDLYAGYGIALDLATSIDLGVMYYVFPDGEGETDYVEPYASISHQIGPVLGTVGAKYAPDQDALGGGDSLYLFSEVEVAIPTLPVTAIAGIGRQEAGLGASYWNWSLGARYARGPFVASLRYVDTDLSANPNAKAGLVASAGFRF